MGFQGDPPRDGRGLFIWAKQVEYDHHLGMLRYLRQYARKQGWPWRMIDWEPDEVAQAYAAAARALARYQRGGGGTS